MVPYTRTLLMWKTEVFKPDGSPVAHLSPAGTQPVRVRSKAECNIRSISISISITATTGSVARRHLLGTGKHTTARGHCTALREGVCVLWRASRGWLAVHDSAR